MRRALLVLLTAAAVAGPAPGALASGHTAPFELVVRTVPATPGLPITVAGEETITDGAGEARWRLPSGEYLAEVAPLTTLTESTRVLFGRWSDGWQPRHTIELRRDRTMELGVIHQHFVELEFADGLRRPLEPGLLQSAVFVNSNGDELTLSAEAEEGEGADTLGGAWLTANRLRRSGAGLLSMPAFYALREAFVAGRDVAQTGAEVFQPEPGRRWQMALGVFPLEVELSSFIYDRPISGTVSLYDLAARAGAPPAAVVDVRDGRGTVEQLPRGDYEVRLDRGGFLPATNLIFTGPRTEQLTVVTSSLWPLVWAFAAVAAAAALLFWRRPRSRLPLLAGAAVVAALVFNLPAIGSASGRPLAAKVAPMYDAAGEFVGFDVEVRNGSAVTVQQTYCIADFQVSLLAAGVTWTATYESPDFHDVEMGECRIHNVRPGTSRQLFVPTPGVEWVVDDNPDIPAGTYPAFVRTFGVAAEPVAVAVPAGVLPAEVLRPPDTDLFDEIPFTTPFED